MGLVTSKVLISIPMVVLNQKKILITENRLRKVFILNIKLENLKFFVLVMFYI